MIALRHTPVEYRTPIIPGSVNATSPQIRKKFLNNLKVYLRLMEECFKLVEEVVNDYVPEIVSSLKSNPSAGETLKEICNLLVDITEIANMEIPRNYSAEEVMRFCIPSTLITIVKPAVDHLFTTYVFGAYPLCYQPIRISIEAMAYSLYADINEPLENGKTFDEKFQELQSRLKGVSMSKVFKKKLGDIIGKELSNKLFALWRKTSNDFLNFTGYIERFKKLDPANPPPSYMIGAFVGYDTSDEPFLEELKNTVMEFGELLKQT